MLERLEIYIVYKWRYVNTLPFLFPFKPVIFSIIHIAWRIKESTGRQLLRWPRLAVSVM